MDKKTFLMSVAVCAVAAVSPALAQNPDGQPISPTAPGARVMEGLEEIIVTAQRVSESSQRAPIALDVLTSDDFLRQNIVRAEDLSRAAPALAASSSGGPTTNFYVRGVGNNTVNAYSDPAIAFNYDGVYIGRPSSTSGSFYDLQRVEVLKGPQGTLYGRNATAGAINVIPNRPQLHETSGSISTSYGNYNRLQSQAALNIPVDDSSALRIAGAQLRRDGLQSDGTGSQNEYGARAQYYAELTPDLDFRVGADIFHQGGTSNSGYYMGAVNSQFGPAGFAGYSLVPSGFSPSTGVHTPESEAYLAARFVPQLGRSGIALSSYPSSDNDYWGVTSEINWNTSAGTLTIQPAYREAELDYQFTSSMRGGHSRESDKQTSVEARWTGNIGSIADYLVGVMYFDESINARATYSQLTLAPFQDFKTGTESIAAFSKLTVHLTDALSLTGAGRYTSDSKRFNGTATTYIMFCGNPAPPQDYCPDLPATPLVYTASDFENYYLSRGIAITPAPLYALPGFVAGTPFVLRAITPINAKIDNDKFTYRLAAQYDVTQSSMVYASFETGYHAGGFSFARGLESYKPETINAYVIGSKNRLFDNRVQLNLETFLWKYKDQQFSQFGYDLGSPPATVFLTRNIGNSTIKGFDVDLDFLATDNTLLTAKVQYLDTKYDSFVYFVPNQGLPPITTCGYEPTSQTTSTGTISVFRVDCSGMPAFNAPKWSVSLNAEQTVPLGDLKIVLQADTRYRSASWTSADYPTWSKADGNFVSNASVTLAEEDDRWYVTAQIMNISDSRRLVGINNNGAASLVVGTTEPPRTYGIRVGGKF